MYTYFFNRSFAFQKPIIFLLLEITPESVPGRSPILQIWNLNTVQHN